eukprot:643681-Amphidinium_carterae.2
MRAIFEICLRRGLPWMWVCVSTPHSSIGFSCEWPACSFLIEENLGQRELRCRLEPLSSPPHQSRESRRVSKFHLRCRMGSPRLAGAPVVPRVERERERRAHDPLVVCSPCVALLSARCKMIDKRMWASQTPLRHFKGLAEDILRKVFTIMVMQ